MAEPNQTNMNPVPAVPQQPVPSAAPNSVLPKTPSNSPWDDDVPAAEAQASAQPSVIGSLEPKADAAQSAPFNVPENIEEKVGQKVSADQYITPKEDAPIISQAPAQSVAAEPEPQSNASTGAVPQQPIVAQVQEPVVPSVVPATAQSLAQENSPSSEVFPAPTGPNVLPKQSLLSRLFAPKAKPAENAAPVIPAGVTSPFNQNAAKKPRFNLAFLQNQRFIAVVGVLAFLSFIVALTELGLISVGAEKVYGALGIERFWGGLAANPENALARSAVQMQKHPSFKLKGTMTLSVDSSMNSSITSPLFSAIKNSFAKEDQNIASPEKATKTAQFYGTSSSSSTSSTDNVNTNTTGSSSDVYNLYSNTNSGSTMDIGTDLTENSDGTEDYNSNTNEEVADDNTNTNDDTTSEETSNIVEVKSNVTVKTNKEGVSADLALDGEQASTINLLLDNGTLLVKSDNIKFAGNADPEKWLSYNLSTTKDKVVQKDIFTIGSDAGFSVKGKREGNEKVGNTRCYKYKIDSMEIGNALSSLGISSDMVQNVSGAVWIGISDKMMRRIDLKIITPVSSSVSTISLSLQFSDFDIENKIAYPTSDEVIEPSAYAGAVLAPTATAADRDAKRKADVQAVLEALKRYKDENGSYPVSKELLKLNSANNIIEQAILPKYLSGIPGDPTEGWYYAYKSNDGTNCSVSARLETATDTEGQLIGGVLLYLKYDNN